MKTINRLKDKYQCLVARRMRYERGNAIIEVSRVDNFGKFPGLWIGTKNPNTLTKVASFRNDICAETFIKWLDYFMEFSANEPTMRKVGETDA